MKLILISINMRIFFYQDYFNEIFFFNFILLNVFGFHLVSIFLIFFLPSNLSGFGALLYLFLFYFLQTDQLPELLCCMDQRLFYNKIRNKKWQIIKRVKSLKLKSKRYQKDRLIEEQQCTSRQTQAAQTLRQKRQHQ